MFCPKCATENPDNSKFCRTCGANLSNVLAAVEGEILPSEIDSSSNFSELYSTGIRNVILGMGFLVASIFMKSIPPADGFLWLLLLIPAVSLVASGVSRILKSEHLKKEREQKANVISQPNFSINQANNALPPTQQEYIKPKTKFETKELNEQPISVTENTTRHLEIKSED